MSFARFSSDDFASDVYVYADAAGGYTVHVAASRVAIDRSGLPEVIAEPDSHDHTQQSLNRHLEVTRRIRNSKTVYTKIDHPLARTTHGQLSATQTVELLQHLEAEGFHVPSGTAEAVLADDAGGDQPSNKGTP